MKHRFGFLLVVVLTLVALSGVAALAAPKVVKIGFLNPLSGKDADAGQQDLNAAQLAVDDINKAGGIKSLGGAKVELVVADTTSDPKQATSVAERLFSAGGLAGAVGTGISGLTMPIQPIAEKYRIPMVTNSINDKITSQGYAFTFQVTPKGSQFGHTQVEFFKYLGSKFGLKAKKAAIVYEDSGYGVSTAKGVKEIAEGAGLEVVLYESYPHGFTDAGPLVTKIKASGAQIVFPVAYTTDAILIINTMKSMKYNPFIIGGGAGFLWPAFGEALGDNVNGFVSVASWNWDSKNITRNPQMADVPKRYEQRFKTFMTEHAGPTYTAVRLIAEAVNQAKSADPLKVRDALSKMDFTKGSYGQLMQPGSVDFDNNGWNSGVHPVMIQWQDGKPRTVFPEADASRPVDYKAITD
ncbi:MAG: ABC transporter substrate-binding protein [Betaproteobacteria bacterium]